MEDIWKFQGYLFWTLVFLNFDKRNMTDNRKTEMGEVEI